MDEKPLSQSMQPARHLEAGKAAFADHDYALAAAETAAAMELDPSLVGAFILHARSQLYLGNDDEAAAALSVALQREPDSLAAQRVLGTLQGARGQFSDAVETLSRAVQREPEEWLTHYNLGVALAQLGRGGAIRHLWHALWRHPSLMTCREFSLAVLSSHQRTASTILTMAMFTPMVLPGIASLMFVAGLAVWLVYLLFASHPTGLPGRAWAFLAVLCLVLALDVYRVLGPR